MLRPGLAEIKFGLSVDFNALPRLIEPKNGLSLLVGLILLPSKELCLESDSFCLSEKLKTAAKDFLLDMLRPISREKLIGLY